MDHNQSGRAGEPLTRPVNGYGVCSEIFRQAIGDSKIV